MSAAAASAAVPTNPDHQDRHSPNAAAPRRASRLRSLARALITFGKQLLTTRHQRTTPAAPAPANTNPPEPTQPRQSLITASPRSSAHLLGLVRAMIGFGRQLAATLQQRTAATDLTEIMRRFGTRDIALILARITRGLLRASALETRLTTRRERPPAAATSHRQPNVAPADRNASAADPDLAHPPTPEDIAEEIRRRPIGAVMADICRDLGIVPGNPLWLELSQAIVANGGSFINLFDDLLRRATTRPDAQPATKPPTGSALNLPVAVTPGTGPP